MRKPWEHHHLFFFEFDLVGAYPENHFTFQEKNLTIENISGEDFDDFTVRVVNYVIIYNY